MLDKTIGDHYIIHAEIGAGGMGTVYRAEDIRLKQLVAIKHLKRELTNPEQLERFRREGEALRNLDHPNIVTILAEVAEDGDHFLVMEYVPGGDLAALMREEPIPLPKALQIALDVCDALTRAHRLGIIHRDLKPANILIGADGVPRLTDFGIAHIAAKERMTDTDTIMGTIDYLPPEVFTGGPIDARADIWAFGVLLFEMIAGQRPFNGDTIWEVIQAINTQPVPDLEQLRPDLPVALVDLVYRMLERDANARIRSVRIVGAALEEILQGEDHSTALFTRFDEPTTEILQPARHNLPAQITEFVGRDTELDELSRLLHDPAVRLVTIVGPGGMGKTRLALEGACVHVADFRDGVFLVELAPLQDAASIPGALAEALSFDFQADGRSHQRQIADYLANKNILLILDNFEHLIAAGSLVNDLLQAAPEVKVLATSRQRLNQTGEHVFNLHGIDFPSWESPEDALEYAAVKLFVQSARRGQPDFEVSADNMDFIARICRLVEGLPLGILLAASWVALLSPAEIADEIQQNIDFLASDMGDLPERQHSIRAVCEYSWQLMSAPEKALFAKLSIFQGGFTREAAQAVAGADLRNLMNLVNKSLITRQADTGRYAMHELLRQFAVTQLDPGVLEALKAAHARFFKEWVVGTYERRFGMQTTEWFARTDHEMPNIRQALAHFIAAGDAEMVQRTIFGLWWYWFRRGHWYEAYDWFKQGIALSDEVTEPYVHAYAAFGPFVNIATGGAGMGAYAQRVAELAAQSDIPAIQAHSLWARTIGTPDYGQAVALFDQAEAILANHVDDNRLEWLRLAYGDRARIHGDLDKAQAIYQRCADLAQANGHPEALSSARGNLGRLELLRGNYDRAAELISETVKTARRLGNQMGLAEWLVQIGTLEMFRGNLPTAEAHLNEALTIWLDAQQHQGVGHAQHMLAYVALERGDVPAATQLVYAALQTTDPGGENFSLREFFVVRLAIVARLAWLAEDFSAAARCLAAANHERDTINYRLEPYFQADMTRLQQQLTERLGADELARIWDAALAPAEALNFALEYLTRTAGE